MSSSSAKDRSFSAKEILAHVKSRKERKKIVDVRETSVQLIIFTLSGDYFAFRMKDVKEILDLAGKEIATVPGCPDFITGIVNVRGSIEATVNLSKFLGMPYDDSVPFRHAIIIAKDENRAGIQVVNVEDVFHTPENSIRPPDTAIADVIKIFVTGEITFNNRHVAILDSEKLLETISA